MLHGWLQVCEQQQNKKLCVPIHNTCACVWQSHRSWLRAAAALRDCQGSEVLLLDFHGHGLSDQPAQESMDASGFLQQLEVRTFDELPVPSPTRSP